MSAEEAVYARNNAITAMRERPVRLATIDGRPAPTLNCRVGRTVVSVQLRAVPMRTSRVAVCGYCGAAPCEPAARVCTAVRCP